MKVNRQMFKIKKIIDPAQGIKLWCLQRNLLDDPFVGEYINKIDPPRRRDRVLKLLSRRFGLFLLTILYVYKSISRSKLSDINFRGDNFTNYYTMQALFRYSLIKRDFACCGHQEIRFRPLIIYELISLWYLLDKSTESEEKKSRPILYNYWKLLFLFSLSIMYSTKINIRKIRTFIIAAEFTPYNCAQMSYFMSINAGIILLIRGGELANLTHESREFIAQSVKLAICTSRDAGRSDPPHISKLYFQKYLHKNYSANLDDRSIGLFLSVYYNFSDNELNKFILQLLHKISIKLSHADPKRVIIYSHPNDRRVSNILPILVNGIVFEEGEDTAEKFNVRVAICGNSSVAEILKCRAPIVLYDAAIDSLPYDYLGMVRRKVIRDITFLELLPQDVFTNLTFSRDTSG
jgi:hypothetical protein